MKKTICVLLAALAFGRCIISDATYFRPLLPIIPDQFAWNTGPTPADFF